MADTRDTLGLPCCVDKTGLATRIVALGVAITIHFSIGTVFNYTSECDNCFKYPNLGSCLFVLASALYFSSRGLMLRALCLKSPPLQSVYKVIVVTLLTNGVLVLVWQQVYILAVRLAIMLHDVLFLMNISSWRWMKYLPGFLLHMFGAVVLHWVVSHLRKAALPQSVETQDERTTRTDGYNAELFGPREDESNEYSHYSSIENEEVEDQESVA